MKQCSRLIAAPCTAATSAAAVLHQLQHCPCPLQVKEAVPDTSTTLCVACMGGARAESAAQQLLAAGYQDVRQMCDGYRGWVNNQLPVQQRSKA